MSILENWHILIDIDVSLASWMFSLPYYTQAIISIIIYHIGLSCGSSTAPWITESIKKKEILNLHNKILHKSVWDINMQLEQRLILKMFT